MERIIKFRAWSFHNKEMYQGNSPYPTAYHFQIYGNGNIGYCPTFPPDDDSLISFYTDTEPEDEKMKIAVMQFTGDKDLTGKESFEDDIIENENGDKRVIKWIMTGFEMRLPNGRRDSTNTSWWFKYTIIGNIYENPELLK